MGDTRRRKAYRRRAVLDPVSISALVLAALAAAAAGAALIRTQRSTPARVVAELDTLMAASAASSRTAVKATDDVAALREEWTRHRLEMVKLLDEAIDAMDAAERKRKSARNERRRAEETRGDAEGAEPATFQCTGCGYEHVRGEDCVQAAKRRFTAQGLSV